MAAKPTIVFVHGAWHNVSSWDVVRSKLPSYPTVAVPLASTGGNAAEVTSHLQDVAVVRQELEKLIKDDGKDVVLVMHSYGGTAGSGAVLGLEKARRQQHGEKGGVVGCLFIAAVIVPKGTSVNAHVLEPAPYVRPDVSL